MSPSLASRRLALPPHAPPRANTLQAENQLLPLLMTLNTPHFDFASCNFTLKHMSRVDSGDSGLSAEGTGRVFYGRHAGVLRSYTLECNYNTGKVRKPGISFRDLYAPQNSCETEGLYRVFAALWSSVVMLATR